MFISFSKTIARFGGFRLGIGMRLNKKNAIWMSLIILFVAMFQLMWYMLILCGWLIYAVCYAIYWCIKKIIFLSSKKQPIKQNTTQNLQTEQADDNPTMTPKLNNSPNENPNNQSPKKVSSIIRWIVGGFFAICALANGFHYSSLIILCATFLMFPLPFTKTLLQEKNLKPIVAIILSVVLFFVGILTSPPSEPTSSVSDDTEQITTTDTKEDVTTTDNTTVVTDTDTSYNHSTTNDIETTKPNNSIIDDEEVEMVWVSSSGKKYHSRATCSGMTSAKEIPLEDAEKQGYTACKKCH